MTKTEAEQAIKNAWICGIFSSIVTTIFILLSMGGINLIAGINAWSFLDVGVLLGLTWGIYRKSRVASVIMLLYYIIGQIILRVSNPNQASAGIFLIAIFIYCYVQGIRGTFTYHRLQKANGETNSKSDS